MNDPRPQHSMPIPLRDRLYRAALLVSSSAAEATTLVENTFRQCRVDGLPDSDLESLLKILWRLASEEAHRRPQLDSAADQVLNQDRVQTALERARSMVGKTFQQLSAETQSVLLFLEVEKLQVGSVASIMQRSETEVAQLHQRGLSTIHDDLFTGTGWVHEGLLDDLPESWIADSLHHVMTSLGPAPTGLTNETRTDTIAGPKEPRTVPPVSGPSLERPQLQPRSRSGDGLIRSRSIAIAILLILVVGFGAQFVYERLSAPPDSNVITLTARAAESFVPDLETDSADRIRRFLVTHLNDDTPMPLVEGMKLVGVGIQQLAPSVQSCPPDPRLDRTCVIALRYIDIATDKPVTVYAFSYRFLEHRGDIELSTDVLRQIQSESNFDLHDLGNAKVVVWRHRAHIFLAVTEMDGRELRPRIYYPPASES